MSGSMYFAGSFDRVRTTSSKAADSVNASSQRGRVLEYIRGRGPAGAIDDEAQFALDITRASARRLELWLLGYIWPTHRTRTTRYGQEACVWVALPEHARLIARRKARIISARYRIGKAEWVLREVEQELHALLAEQTMARAA